METFFEDAIGFPLSKLTGAEVCRAANLSRWEGVEELEASYLRREANRILRVVEREMAKEADGVKS